MFLLVKNVQNEIESYFLSLSHQSPMELLFFPFPPILGLKTKQGTSPVNITFPV